jgi:hypothetical protein
MFNVLMEAGTQTAAGNPQSNVFAQAYKPESKRCSCNERWYHR